jgi:hypothetical protein
VSTTLIPIESVLSGAYDSRQKDNGISRRGFVLQSFRYPSCSGGPADPGHQVKASAALNHAVPPPSTHLLR